MSSGARTLTQDERSGAARRAIIDAAVRVLAEEGYRRTTFTRIQEVSGVSRGLISYHFGSKVKLIEAVITSVRDVYTAEAIDDPAVSGGSGLGAVLGMVDSYLRRLEANPRPATLMLVLAMSADAEEPEVRNAVRQRYSEMRADLQNWLERGKTDGSVRRSVDPAAYAGVLEGLVRGVALQFVVDREDFDLAAARTAAVAVARSALSTATSLAHDSAVSPSGSSPRRS